MNNTFCKTALCVSTAVGIGMTLPALAQDGLQLEEIVVTARRMEERLQDVPISMTVFNQQQLDDHNVVNAADLAAYTPSLTANQRFGPENTNFAIRGFTQELRTAASVAVYFADVVAPRGGQVGALGGDGAGPGAFFDLENVQVLKGPQGTLFGRNTTGGAILLVPTKPTDAFGGYIEGSAGNYDMKRIQGVFNTPLGENARLRLGMDSMKRDGYLENISGVGPSDFDNVDYYSGRASLVVDIAPDIENYTIATYTKSDTNGSVPQIFVCDPTRPQVGALFGAAACDQIERAGGDFYTVENAVPGAQSVSRQWQLINTTTWELSDRLTVKNILSYGQYNNKVVGSAFGDNFSFASFFPPPLGGEHFDLATFNPTSDFDSNDQETFTEELQFQGSSTDGRLVWQAGGYLEHSDPGSTGGSRSPSLIQCADVENFQCRNLFGSLVLLSIDPVSFLSGTQLNEYPSVIQNTVLATGGLAQSTGTIEFRNYGIYGQATYELTERLKVTGGIRYTSDETEGESQLVTFRYDPTIPTVLAPSSPISAQCQNPLSGNTAITDNVLGNLDACNLSFRQKSEEPTWTIDLSYTPTENTMVYIKHSRGYRQGGVNIFGAAGYNTFDPEQVDAFEGGIKTSFQGPVSGTFNVAAFWNDFKDQQLQVGFVGKPGIASTTGIVNTGKSRIWGLEIESSLNLSENFRLDFGYAYLDTELKSAESVTLDPDGPFAATVATFAVGEDLPLTPKHKVVVNAAYALPVDEALGTLSVGATYVYTDEQMVNPSEFGKLGSTDLVNLNLDWKSIGGSPMDAAFFVTNVFDKEYEVSKGSRWNSFAFEGRQIGQPRILGLRVRWNYGD